MVDDRPASWRNTVHLVTNLRSRVHRESRVEGKDLWIADQACFDAAFVIEKLLSDRDYWQVVSMTFLKEVVGDFLVDHLNDCHDTQGRFVGGDTCTHWKNNRHLSVVSKKVGNA